MRPVALAIALGYGLAVLAILSHRHLRRPWLLGAAGAGAIAFPITLFLATPIQGLLAQVFGWDMDAYSTSLGIGLLGAAVVASVNEIFKLAPALLVWSLGGEQGDALAFGAAAGAGFAVVGAHQVILLAFMARTLPISSSAGFVTSLVQQFGFVSVNAASTALAAYGAARRRIGPYLVAAILCETLYSALGLFYSVRVYTSSVWAFLSLGVSLLLLGYAYLLTLRPAAADGPTPAP